jgi:hypothetical protein
VERKGASRFSAFSGVRQETNKPQTTAARRTARHDLNNFTGIMFL